MKTIVCVILSVFYTFCFSQSSIQTRRDSIFQPRALYANLSAGVRVISSMTAYYESTLRTRGNSRTYLKAGLGYYAVFGRGGMHVIGNLGWYGGGVKHKIECGGGLDYFILGDLQGAIPLSASLGYRFQKPQKRFLFRTGFSYPEGVYIGAGYRF